MPVAKIDKVKLHQMLSQGKSGVECAQHFGVTPGAISRARKELSVAVVKNVTLESAHKVVEKELDLLDQLYRINSDAHEMLDNCMAWMRGEDEALQVLEGQVRKVRVGNGEDAQEVTEYKFKDPREIALKAMQRIEAQLRLQFDIYERLYGMQGSAEFQREVMQVITEADKETGVKLARRLKELCMLRLSVNVTD